MAGETSDPGGQQDVSFIDKDDEALEVAERALDTDALNPSLYGDYAGSTALSNQMNNSLTGNSLYDALVPGLGTLSLISQFSGQNLQNNLQRGASPVYGYGGTVQGTQSKNLFGGTVYSGNPDLDPNNSPNNNNSDSGVNSRRSTGRPGSAIKGVSNTTSKRITPSGAVRGGAPSLLPKLLARSSGGYSGVQTSSQGLLGSAPVQRKTLLGS